MTRLLAAVALALAGAALAVGPVLSPLPATAATNPCQPNAVSQNPLALAALAFEEPTPQAGSAANQCTPPSGTKLTGAWSIVVDASAPLGLQTFSVALVPNDPGVPGLGSGARVTRSYPAALQPDTKYSDTISMGWDTTALTPYNGHYTVTATAVAWGLGQPAVASLGNLLVNNPPVAPAGAGVGLSGTTPVVSWNANPEPDITGYQILRSAGSGFSLVGTTTKTSFADSKAPQGGPLTYEVIAVRNSPVDPAGVLSAPSTPTGQVVPGTQPGTAPAATTTKAGTTTTKTKATTTGSSGAASPDPNNTFSPTLPFGQALPTETATVTDPGLTTQTVAAGPTFGGSSPTEKWRFLALGAFLFTLALIIIKYARGVGRDEE